MKTVWAAERRGMGGGGGWAVAARRRVEEEEDERRRVRMEGTRLAGWRGVVGVQRRRRSRLLMEEEEEEETAAQLEAVEKTYQGAYPQEDILQCFASSIIFEMMPSIIGMWFFKLASVTVLAIVLGDGDLGGGGGSGWGGWLGSVGFVSAIFVMRLIMSSAMVVGGQVVPRPMMYLALTYDHRLIDGREAVFFLRLDKVRRGDGDARSGFGGRGGRDEGNGAKERTESASEGDCSRRGGGFGP
ncbi:hypothetical protein Droror1_Dr00005695 [Drosera rotundifolia]